MISRRTLLQTTLAGLSGLGLRTLATGLPASLLLDPRRALAQATPACTDKAQFVIFNTSGAGDPINANAPGSYEDPGIYHSPDPALAPTQLRLRSRITTAAKPWSTLPQDV